ncbi:hypothetical protein EV356DRAFT_458547, partial [Viridothelium virens]
KKYKIQPQNIYNMDKKGFFLKQIIIIFIHLNNIKKEKVVLNKQDWVINIKCISAAGKLFAPFLVFKGDYINT